MFAVHGDWRILVQNNYVLQWLLEWRSSYSI